MEESRGERLDIWEKRVTNDSWLIRDQDVMFIGEEKSGPAFRSELKHPIRRRGSIEVVHLTDIHHKRLSTRTVRIINIHVVGVGIDRLTLRVGIRREIRATAVACSSKARVPGCETDVVFSVLPHQNRNVCLQSVAEILGIVREVRPRQTCTTTAIAIELRRARPKSRALDLLARIVSTSRAQGRCYIRGIPSGDTVGGNVSPRTVLYKWAVDSGIKYILAGAV